MAKDFDLQGALNRIVQMEIDVSDSVSGKETQAKAYFPYQQESFPYWTNRVTSMLPTYPFSQDTTVYPFNVGARLVLGHLDEGFEGEILQDAWDYIPEVLNYFKSRPYLNNSADTTKFDDIWNTTGEGMEIINVIGPAAFVNSGVGPIQVGVEFTLLLPFIAKQY